MKLECSSKCKIKSVFFHVYIFRWKYENIFKPWSLNPELWGQEVLITPANLQSSYMCKLLFHKNKASNRNIAHYFQASAELLKHMAKYVAMEMFCKYI